MTDVSMTSTRPYLVRAFHEWISDNGLTPYLLVDARVQGVHVPASAIREGRVVLNLALRAVSQLDLGKEDVRFLARFGGVSQAVVVPMHAVLAIYAQENGKGMVFDEHEKPDAPPPPAPSPSDEPPKRSHLRVVK